MAGDEICLCARFGALLQSLQPNATVSSDNEVCFHLYSFGFLTSVRGFDSQTIAIVHGYQKPLVMLDFLFMFFYSTVILLSLASEKWKIQSRSRFRLRKRQE